MRKIYHTSSKLKRWNKYSYGHVKMRIIAIEKEIEKQQHSSPSQENLEKEANLLLELEEWQAREDIKWKQKSRELWLKEGDHNSKFFHASTIIRRRKNNIAEIKLENGNYIYEKEDIEKYFEKHFQELYNSSNPNFPRDLENLISPCIEPEENEDLIRIPSP